MKIMNTKEAIIAMANGLEITSDEFKNPDYTYCTFDKTKEMPFRYINQNNDYPMEGVWDIEHWRLRNYTPRDKELVWAYADDDIAYAGLKYYDAKNEATFDYLGNRGGIQYPNYAPFDGTPPPNMCKQEDLEN